MTVLEFSNEEKNIEFEVLKKTEDMSAKRRCFIAELVRKALDKHFANDNLNVSADTSLYKLPIINEELDIIDFEINNLAVHIVPTIDKSQNLNVYIPKIYKFYNYKPDVIIFVNFSKTLSKVDILGYLTNINLNNTAIAKKDLQSPDTLAGTIKNLKSNYANQNDNIVNTTNELMLAFIDNALSNEGKLFFLKQAILNKKIRENYKLFYSLNCDFILIAHNIKQQNKLQANKTAEENIVLAEIPEEFTENAEDNIDSLAENTIDDIQQEDFNNENLEENFDENAIATEEDYNSLLEETFAEDTIIEENPIENISVVQEPEIEQANDVELQTNEPVDNTELLTPDNILQEENIETFENNTQEETNEISNSITNEPDEFVLPDDEGFDLMSDNDDDVFEINSTEEETFPQIDAISKNTNSQLEIEQTSMVEENPVNVNSISSENNISQNENELTGVSNENDSDGSDYFDFLSDITENASNEENSLPAQEDNINQNIEIQQVQAVPENQPPEFVASQVSSEQVEMNNIESSANQTINSGVQNEFNAAFDNAMENKTELNNNFSQPVQVGKTNKKSNFIPILLVCAVLATGGFYLYQNKDNLMGMIKGNNQEENDMLLPPPINADAIDQTQGANPNVPNNDTVAPPPTTTATVPTPQKPLPKTSEDATEPEALPSLPTTVEPPKPKHLNDAIATALSKDYSGVRISKVSWEVSETLVKNPSVSRYFTIAGKSIKNALSQDLAAATEPSFKDNVTVNITYLKNGNVSKVQMGSSSGSKQIDDMICKSVKDTLNYIKMPSLNLNKPEYQVKLIIRL